MDGWRRIGSDDDFQIRQALPVGLGRARFCSLGSLGSVFHV
jgi:hypothetical protein